MSQEEKRLKGTPYVLEQVQRYLRNSPAPTIPVVGWGWRDAEAFRTRSPKK